eukprot:3500820-Amphidinium_carterae.1
MVVHAPCGLHVVVLGEGLFVSLILGAALLPYSCFQFWLLVNNMTTIEYLERGGYYGLSRYDEGILHNITSVLGSQWWVWFLPVCGPAGDGTRWQEEHELPLAGVWTALVELYEDSLGLARSLF